MEVKIKMINPVKVIHILEDDWDQLKYMQEDAVGLKSSLEYARHELNDYKDVLYKISCCKDIKKCKEMAQEVIDKYFDVFNER
jgi:hypothetical protein